MIDVSIIIINFNGLKILNDCIDSILKTARGYAYEIIVIDNGSTDGPVRDILGKSENIVLIQNENNLGFSAANNQGIRAAKGNYLLILNNDTVFFENTLKKILSFVEEKGEDVIVGCKILNPDSTLQISVVDFDNLWNSFTETFFLYKLFPRSKFFNKYYQNYLDAAGPVEVGYVKGCFLFCSRKAALELNGFDEQFFFYMEETDFCYRFSQKGGKVIYYPETSIIHIGAATTGSWHWFKFKSQTVSKMKYYQKHFKGLKFFLMVLLHYTGVALRVIVYLISGTLTFNKSLFVKSYYYFRQLFVYPQNAFLKQR